jgi:signal transduction histidine kinase
VWSVAAVGFTQDAGRAAVPARQLLWLIGAGGVGAAVVAVLLSLASDHQTDAEVQGALMAWIVLAYVLAGLVAWWRRPRNHLGPLMIAAGFGVFLSSLTAANAPLPYTIGIAFDLAAAVVFLHVCLAFPSGRLHGRPERLLIAVGYLAALFAQLVGMALGGFGPDNLVEIVAEPETAYDLLRVQLFALTGVMLGGIALMFVRRRHAATQMRRSVAWLADSFALALLMLAFLYGSAALGLVSGQTVFETIRRAALFAVGLAPLVFLVGLLDARLARSAVGDLFVELRGDPSPAGLRSALARALRDPSLTLAYWLPEFGNWADADGRPVELPEPGGSRAVTLVERDGAPVAAFVHDASLQDDPGLLDAVSAAAAIALENVRLNVELRARLDELRGSRARIVEAGDSERRRLERNLHDGAQQRLVSVALQLRLLQNRIRDDPAAAEMASAVGDELSRSLDELRELARGLHPAVLEHGLGPALDALATRSQVPTTVEYDIDVPLPEPVALAAYFVAAETLTNVARYAQATSAIVRAWRDGPTAVIEIADDGIGGAHDAKGTGLRGLADRVEALDGRLRVVSPVGAGTVVTAELPCAS